MSTPNELARIERNLRERPFPTRFAVELCAECNLNCSMCHHDAMQRPKGVMPFALWKKCADEIAEVAPQTNVWFSFCGEPLLQPDLLMDMLEYGREVGLQSMSVNTNGMYLVPEIHERLLSTGIQRIVIGVDGFSAPVYEAIRVGAVRDVVYRNVEQLIEARLARSSGPEVVVQFIEMDENQHEAEEFLAYWNARGASVKMRNQLSWGGKFSSPLDISFDDRIPCPWAITMMHVFWDGRVPRCPGDTEGEEGSGNAWHESLSDLWSKLGSYRDQHMAHEFDQLPKRCLECTDWMVGAAKHHRPERGVA